MWVTLSNQLMTCLDQKADLPTPNWESGNSPAHCLQTSSATAPLPASPEDCLWIWTASLLSLSPAWSLSRVRLLVTPWAVPYYSPPGISQAGVLEWVAISFSRGSSQPRDRSQVSCIIGRSFTIWATKECSHLLAYPHQILDLSLPKSREVTPTDRQTDQSILSVLFLMRTLTNTQGKQCQQLPNYSTSNVSQAGFWNLYWLIFRTL